MKTYFCESCGRPIIEAELTENLGRMIEDKAYCYQCMDKAGSPTEAETEPEVETEADAAADISEEPVTEEATEKIPDADADDDMPPADEEADDGPDEIEEEPDEEEPDEDAPEDDENPAKDTPAPTKPKPRASSRRPAAGSSRRATSVSGRRRSAGASSRRAKVDPDSDDFDEANEPRGYSSEDKIKFTIIVVSAIMVLVGLSFPIVRGCHYGEEGKKIIIVSKLSAKLSEARSLKAEGINALHAGKFAEALDKLYASQEKYYEVLDKVRADELSPEDIEAGLSFDYVEDECGGMNKYILMAREEKLKQEERQKNRFND